MLESLHINNYALIKQLDIPFHKGFTVITGETGAGKSIILGALALLQGQRADTKAIRTGEKKCTIEAVFNLKDYSVASFFKQHDLDYDEKDGACIIRRELLLSGKSRAFINDTPVALNVLKELAGIIIDIHSQHKNLLLEKEAFLIDLLDTIAKNKTIKKHYEDTFYKYEHICKSLNEAVEQLHKDKENQDFISFQIQQLEEAQLQEKEQEELEEESKTLDHIEDIKQRFFKAEELFENNEGDLLQQIKNCAYELQRLENIYSPGFELGQRLESNYIELKDIANEIAYQSSKIEFDPERQDFINERLNTIYTLEQKHQVNSCSELLQLLENLHQQLDKIENSDDYIKKLQEEKERLFKDLELAGNDLTGSRKKAVQKIIQQMLLNLKELGLPNIQIEIALTPRKEFHLSGKDLVEFLFSANKNVPLQNIAKIASGGEIARVMLSLKAIVSEENQLPTIIFDEIDTGVSGHIADKMAHMMQKMSKGRQVISISHLPQIAAAGNYHYRVYKTSDDYETNSHITELKLQERIKEIAHMLSGTELTEAAINNAKTLLQQATK